MGHVPAGPVPEEGAGDDVPRRQRRGARADAPAVARRSLGDRGEDLAAWFLSRRGGRVVGRNLRAGGGEIDLLVTFGRRRVVVEVKAVTGGAAEPLANFDARKASAVRQAARALDPPVRRVDLVVVSLDREGVGFRWLRDV